MIYVNYYGANGCTYETDTGSPLLVANDIISEETLKQCGFERRLSDGKLIGQGSAYSANCVICDEWGCYDELSGVFGVFQLDVLPTLLFLKAYEN